jgi:hypothetical protein
MGRVSLQPVPDVEGWVSGLIRRARSALQAAVSRRFGVQEPIMHFFAPRARVRRAACYGLMLLAFSGVARSQPATFLVGSDVCDFSSIQSAIDAAAAHPGPDFIRIATNATYTAQALKINNQELTITGGYPTCASANPPAGARTIISGAGGAADSVVEFDGSGFLHLFNLHISDGDETNDGHGGGVDFSGAGTLSLFNAEVSGNRAGYGGGIAFYGEEFEDSTLFIYQNVLVQNNSAVNSGGGIRISGDAQLIMRAPDSAIVGNVAQGTASDTGYGGGIQILPPASAHIGSPGHGSSGVVAFNRAKYGGGIAVSARDDGDEHGYALLYTLDPQKPVRVHDNIASVAGGGMFANVNADVGPVRRETTAICAFEFRIDHNQAPDGAAVFLDSQFALGQAYGARLMLNVPDQSFPPDCGVDSLPPYAIAQNCAPGVTCNSIDNNIVRQANGQAASGAVIAMREDVNVVARRVRFVDNLATDVMRGLTTRNFQLYDCLIARNTLGARVIATDGPARIENCTIVDNALGQSDVLGLTGAVALVDNIIWQPGHFSLGSAHGALEGGYILTNDPNSVQPLIATDRAPRFIDPGGGDYRLRAASPAVDFAPSRGGVDLELATRDRDLPNINAHGRRDLGAFERSSLGPLVLNASFNTNVVHWSVVTPAVSNFDPNENAPTSPAGGAMNFHWENTPVAQARVVSRAQCLHLPIAGTYRLDGAARTTGGTAVSGQAAVLHWALRRNGSEACNGGPIDLQGDVRLATGTAWTRAGVPAEIALAPEHWTPNSSLEISLVMVATGLTFPPGMHGWFDDITLTLDGNEIFSDGFE